MSTITLQKLSHKYQMVLPKAIRKQMHLTAGNQIMVKGIDEDMAVILKRPDSITDKLSGLGKEVWEKLGGTDNYIKQERASWEKSK